MELKRERGVVIASTAPGAAVAVLAGYCEFAWPVPRILGAAEVRPSTMAPIECEVERQSRPWSMFMALRTCMSVAMASSRARSTPLRNTCRT